MNKKNISLILVGTLFLALQFYVKLGSITVDVCSDIVGFVLIILGILPLANRNINFKKARNISFPGLIAVITGQVILCMDWGESYSLMLSVSGGLTTIFAIYSTYYFTEGLILEAKFQEKSAVTRSFRLIWTLFAALIFIHYVAFMSNISTASIIVKAISAIVSIYYCSSVLNGCKALYMEGLPKKHMM